MDSLIAFIITVNYEVFVFSLPAVAILSALILIIFYKEKTVPEMITIFFGFFLLGVVIVTLILKYIFSIDVGGLEVISYTPSQGSGP